MSDLQRRPTFVKVKPPIGSRPGTLAIPSDSPPPRIQLFEYGPAGVREREVTDLAGFSAPSGEQVTWVDVQGLGDEAALRRLAELFSLHPLALEDAVNVPQRAKCQLYPDHQLVIARMPQVDGEGGITVPQVCFVVGARTLVTFQERYFGFFEPVRERLRSGIGPIWQLGPDYLCYALVDTLVDRYFPIVEALSSELEELEEQALGGPKPELLQRLQHLRRKLVVLRRVGWPQREALNAIIRDPSPYVSDEARGFFRGTYDHMVQIMELVDSSRDMAGGVQDLYLSSVSNRTNDVMMVLTLMASIFIPLTFIAGIYGMNFDSMPELSSPLGYPVVLGAMIFIAVGMLAFFRRRGWIGRGRRGDGDGRG